MKKFTAEGALLLATTIWGATFVIVKTALKDISPMLFVSFRFSFAALILLPFIIKTLKKFDRKTIYGGLLVGLFYFLGFTTQTAGLNYTSATKSGFITGTFVVFTPIFQLIIEKRRPALGNIIGVILVLAGLIFLSSKGDTFLNVFKEIGENFNKGDFLTLLCAIFFALYIVYLDIESKKLNLMSLVFLQIAVTGLGGFLFAAVFSFIGLEGFKFTYSNNLLFAILYTAILATVITTILQTRYQKETTPTKAGIIFSFEPIFSALVAFLALNEKISDFRLIGCAFIFIGLLVTELINNKENSLVSSNN
jgi:drug/metabolite transporter (DMT)-like permease